MRPRPDIAETTAIVAGLLITLGALPLQWAAFEEFASSRDLIMSIKGGNYGSRST
jgi:hypothetical protein